MTSEFDIEQRWPDLFVGLTDVQRRAVVQPWASAWHEGWQPNRDDVKNLADYVRGDIDITRYQQLADQAAAARASASTG